MTVNFMFVCYNFSSVRVAEWPPFRKELSTRLAVYSHCILSICNFSFSRCGFGARICFDY